MAYGYKSLEEFKKEYIRESEESIIVPEYSAYKEYDARVAELMKEGFRTNPTDMILLMNSYLRTCVREDWDISVIGYHKERETYIAAIEAVKALNIKYIPTVYTYVSDKIEDILNSFALGYGNSINIFLSYILFDEILKGLNEKAFIIGHELGHNQNNATAPHIVGIGKNDETTRFGEYTADRAGLLACRDVEAAARALMKVSTVERFPQERYIEVAKELVENAEQNLEGLSRDRGTHPCLERRIAAMKLFQSTKMYARLTGAETNDSMLSDEDFEKQFEKITGGLM